MEMHTDVHKLEEELGIKIYPGTEVMKDTGHVQFAKGKSGVLVPQPSNELSDPLNWSPFWKGAAVTSATLLGFLQGFGPLSLASQVPFYIEAFGTDVNGVVNMIGVTILVLGFSNFLWVPIATQFGRRPCAILSSTVCLASCIWRAKATTYHSFLGACILNGIGAGPGETLPPIIIADVLFLDHRGLSMGLYWWSYFGSLMVGPIVAGQTSQQHGWQSFWWINTALFAALIVFLVFFLPETKYKRSNATGTGNDSDSTDAKPQDQQMDTIEKHVDENLGKGRPSSKQFLPVSGFEKSKSLFLRDVLTPWVLFTFPIVQWASFVSSWSSGCFLVLNLTQSLVFAAPPYNFSAGAVGYTNFAILGGAILGLATAGPGGDALSRLMTRRNKMVREPEMRLPMLWPYCLILALGTTIVAVGYQHQWDWKIIVILGYGAIGWQVAALPAIAITYAIDSYKPVSGEFLVSMTVNKNVWGYALSQFLVKWIVKDGFITPLLVNAGLCLAFTFLGSLILVFFGKTARGWSRNSYIHSM